MPLTNQTRLFRAREKEAEFLQFVAVWRIMWRGGDQRVILREMITDDGPGFLQDFPEGCTLDLLGGKCSDKRDRHQGIWLYRFVDCKVNRSWIPDAGVLHPHEIAALHYWLEIDCEILTFMMRLEK